VLKIFEGNDVESKASDMISETRGFYHEDAIKNVSVDRVGDYEE
jgi:hypothetical protein